MGEVCPSEPTELWFRPFTKKKIADLTSEEVAALRVKAQERAVSLNKNVVPMKTHSYLGEDHGHPIISMKATYGAVYIIRDPRDVAVSGADTSGGTSAPMTGIMPDPLPPCPASPGTFVLTIQ